MRTNIAPRGAGHGMTLLEVLIAITIFAHGILALTLLQGSLARSAGDAHLRTVAVQVAEETIERYRGFSRLTTDPAGVEYAYEDISTSAFTSSRGDFDFGVNVNVAEYWYNRGAGAFTTTAPPEAAVSDFKLVSVQVDWGENPEFVIDSDTSTTSALGSGSATLTEVISSVTSAADAKSATGGTGGLYLPSVNYDPGSNPDIIAISLGDNRFKESTTPLPKVIRADALAETTFDVVTYLQDNQGATFLRREEFRSISCECSLRVPDMQAEVGLRPTVWNGNDYTEGERVSKVYGVSTSNVQSQYCDICCRDHHDGGSGEDDDPNDPGRALYNPFRDSADYWSSGVLAGDHKHYFRNSSGGLSLATTDGSAYMEACRMVRKNGFWRVAHDLRQEGLNAFPESFLDQSSEVGAYSDYVTGATDIFVDDVLGQTSYPASSPQLTPPQDMSPAISFPASTPDSATTLPTALGASTQQLRSRGIYLDYLSKDLRSIVSCLKLGGSGVACGAPGITSSLEIVPFYDVQTTWLARWTEEPVNFPIDVSNQTIATNNAHSRGIAALTGGEGNSTVNAEIHKGNLGMTGTDPVDPNYSADLHQEEMFVSASSTTPPPALNEYVVSGQIISSINGFKASDVEISFEDAQCNRTSIGFECLVEIGTNNPRLTVLNYYKQNTIRVACSNELSIQGIGTGSNGWTRFNLPTGGTSTADIIIRLDQC